MSSAYSEMWTEGLMNCVISLMARENKRPLRTPPCWIPSDCWKERKYTVWRRTRNDLLERRAPLRPREWSFKRMPVLHVVSKARVRSRKTAKVVCLWWKDYERIYCGGVTFIGVLVGGDGL